MDDTSKTINDLTEEIEQLENALELIDTDDDERPLIYDRLSQLKGRLSELKIKRFLDDI